MNKKIRIKPYFTVVVFVILIFVYMIFFRKIEVVAPGQGLTGIHESNVSLKSPSNSYVVNMFASVGDDVKKGQKLLEFRNLQDEYQLQEVSESLVLDKLLLEQYQEEKCFLTSDVFNQGNNAEDTAFNSQYCDESNNAIGSGGQYILNFYQDYLQEQRYILQLEKEKKRHKEELLNKKEVLGKKRNILIRGGGETLRLFDMDAELSDLNSDIISFDISKLDTQKNLNDKFMTFQLRRSERALTLDEKINELSADIIQKKYQQELLQEKKENAMIRSPLEGSVLDLTEGIAIGTFIQEGNPIYTLKKSGASQEVVAKFESRYRYFLEIGRDVKVMTNSTGFSKAFTGVIKDISSDSLPYEPGQENSKRYYRVAIEPDEAFLKLKLNLGIDVNVMVVESEITAFEYMLSVIPDVFNFKVW
ncbi:HlyD family efflux transporter periplasmic adaptor subunit [Marinomonas sp. IMCC 4694]|uniref:HlyD family efflux transporter periplasmic adaptor subunit n=1 Tax=Marinomonas sp. IMCC 4694 TaxID=2605432 RepID=UPI0011E7816D|nr:HlyD family efflux transporter periplasmic adaptor subunit [Marinomonas sp. IMCC 4694]TYL48407.1 HlyD family efflux transporter periplasmic adaptor subunit [Marinomonas sp. IMCC 4694]